MSIWAAALFTLGYLIIRNILSLGSFEIISKFTDGISLQIELAELFTALITLFLLIWFLLKRRAFYEKSTYSYSKVKLIILLIIIVIGIRLIQDPAFRFKNILFNEPLFTSGDEQHPLIMTMPVLVKLLNVLIFLPILEELFFRKLIFKGLIIKYSNIVLALAISSALFAISHLSLENAVPTFLLGIVSGFIYYKTSSILYPILLHIFSNLIWFALLLDPNDYYWKIQNQLNFGLFYWAIVALGSLLVLVSINEIRKIKII